MNKLPLTSKFDLDSLKGIHNSQQQHLAFILLIVSTNLLAASGPSRTESGLQ